MLKRDKYIIVGSSAGAVWEINFSGSIDTIQILVTSTNKGTFSVGSAANANNITVSTDGVNFSAISYPFSPAIGILWVKRDPSNSTGFFKLS